MTASTLEQLEVKIAFLERANTELSEALFRQHREIEILRGQLVALAERVATSSGSEALSAEQERPPHY
jgi:SlyX protein